MKKTFFFALMATLVIILTTSCTNYPGYRPAGPGVTKRVTVDTVITNPTPMLADRFDCNGNLLSQQKITGWMLDTQHITQTTKFRLSDKELNGLGYFYKKVHDSVLNPNFWERRSFGELFLLVLLAGLLLGFLLRSILNRPANPGTPPAQAVPPATPPTPVKNQANLISQCDMSEMIETLGKNGGSLETRADGSFSANFNPAKDEMKSPEVQADKIAPVKKTEETKPAQ